MKKDNNLLPNFNINLNDNHSGEEVPFITISNSKSNSSKNQNSKTSSNNNKISLTHNNSSSNSKNNNQNSSSNIIRKKLSRNNNNKSNQNSSFSDKYLIKPLFDTSFNNQLNNYSSNRSLSEDKKEIQTEIKDYKTNKIETPKKKIDNRALILTNNKYRNKAGKPVNFEGKNLMDYFKNMSIEVENAEEKTKNRISSVENVSNKNFQLKQNIININKSWNKNNIKIIPIKLIHKYDKDFSKNKNQKIEKNYSEFTRGKKKRSTSNIKISSLKSYKNRFDFENLLNKYINKSKKTNINFDLINFQKFQDDKINYIKDIKTEKKLNIKKIKKTPKSDSYKKKLSCSYLKVRDNALKNLFHDKKQRQNEEININSIINSNKKRLSTKVIKEKKPTFSTNIFDKIQSNKNTLIKIKPIKKDIIENKNNINIKIINSHNESNSYFYKFKDNKELLKKDKHYINKGFNLKNIKK